jgi:hypothetical protein
MNITIERQKEIYEKIGVLIKESDLFNNNQKTEEFERYLSLPKLEAGDRCIYSTTNGIDNIFDVLGYFSMGSPCSVFLCDEMIKKHAEAKEWCSTILTEVVYIHECAHYIHYHLNSGNFRNCPFKDQEHSLYVETFAQIVTHIVVELLTEDHFKIFHELKNGQSPDYTSYTKEAIACNIKYLLDLFLNPKLHKDKSVLDIVENEYKHPDQNNKPGYLWSIKEAISHSPNWRFKKSAIFKKMHNDYIIELIKDRIKNKKEFPCFEFKSVWNSDEFADIQKELKISKEEEDDCDLLSALEGIGH